MLGGKENLQLLQFASWFAICQIFVICGLALRLSQAPSNEA